MRLARKAVAAGTCSLFLLALVVGVGGAAVAATSPTNPCAQPDALLQAGDYTGAYAAYAAVTPTDSSCAKQGMTAAGALQAASQLITMGLATQADAEIVNAIGADPTLTLPDSMLTKAVAGRAVALAETLNADGFHQQAVQILLFVTEAHAGTPLDPAARAILATPGEPASASIGHSVETYVLGWDGFVLVIILVVVALAYYPLTKRRLYLQPFTLADADIGAGAEHLRTRVREELQRLALEHARTDKGRRLRIDIAGPYDEPLDIGSVVDHAPEKLKFIGALIGLVIKRYPRICRPRLVTGALCANVTVRMGLATVNKHELCCVTIEHKDLGFPPVSPSAANPVAAQYAQLALPAAAWVILNRYDKYTLGGTRDLDSFIKFAVGYEWQQQDRAVEAEEYYIKARDADPRHNTAAAVNLARLWQQREVLSGPATAGDAEDWRDLLHRVTEATRSKTGDLQWYRSRYLLSLGLADQDRLGRSATNEKERWQASRLAVELAVEVMERLKHPDGDVPREFLENSQGPSLALAVSQMIPSAETVEEVITTGFIPDNVTDDDVLRELKKAQAGVSVSPEVIVPYIEACPPDSEIDYNLYRYHLNRLQACEEAITAIEEELREEQEPRETDEQTAEQSVIPNGFFGPQGAGDEEIPREVRWSEAGSERQGVLLRERLQEARGAAGDASAALNRYAERLSRSPDPVLRARVSVLSQVKRFDDERDDYGEEEPPLDHPAPSAYYAGEPDNRMLPYRTDAVSAVDLVRPEASWAPDESSDGQEAGPPEPRH